MLTVERIQDPARLFAMREEWNALLGASAADTVFLTWEWLHTWWRHLGGRRRLSVLSVRSGGTLVALAPLALTPPQLGRGLPFRSLQFLGTGTIGSDYLDLIVRRGWEERALDALTDSLRGERTLLELRPLGPEAQARRLAAWLGAEGWSGQQARVDVCPFVTLGGHTWASYLATLGSAHRYNFQRRLRNLQKQFSVSFQPVTSEAERGPALVRLIALHRARWEGRGTSEAFDTDACVSFHEELTRLALARGWLRLLELRLDDRAVAAVYGFRFGRTFSFYQSGLDPALARHSVGLVAMGLAIKSALEEGAEEYDLLHGSEPYKFLWAREARELRRVELFPPRWQGAVCQRWMALGRAARRSVHA